MAFQKLPFSGLNFHVAPSRQYNTPAIKSAGESQVYFLCKFFRKACLRVFCMEDFMNKIKMFCVALTFLFMPFLAVEGSCCVGRVLTVAVDQSVDQNIIGNMLSVFINERTGTTVQLKRVASLADSFRLVKDGDADLFIAYIGASLPGQEKALSAGSPEETYSLVKQYYRENYSMVWLKPYGYHGPVPEGQAASPDSGSLAAVVTTRKVLDRFPILDRVINKLSDRIDDDVMNNLIKESASGDIEKVVKSFLKKRNMI